MTNRNPRVCAQRVCVERSCAQRSCVERTCVACRSVKPPGAMLRIAAQNGEAPRLDAGKIKALGRGAYLCFDLTCARKAWKKRAIERALKLKTPLNAAFVTQVETAIENFIETAAATQINSQESQHMN